MSEKLNLPKYFFGSGNKMAFGYAFSHNSVHLFGSKVTFLAFADSNTNWALYQLKSYSRSWFHANFRNLSNTKPLLIPKKPYRWDGFGRLPEIQSYGNYFCRFEFIPHINTSLMFSKTKVPDLVSMERYQSNQYNITYQYYWDQKKGSYKDNLRRQAWYRGKARSRILHTGKLEKIEKENFPSSLRLNKTVSRIKVITSLLTGNTNFVSIF